MMKARNLELEKQIQKLQTEREISRLKKKVKQKNGYLFLKDKKDYIRSLEKQGTTIH